MRANVLTYLDENAKRIPTKDEKGREKKERIKFRYSFKDFLRKSIGPG